MSGNFNQPDRDLLIELKTEVRALRSDIKELKDVTTDKSTDHEIRIRRLEQWGAMAIGALTLVQFIGFGYLLTLLK